MGIYPDLAQAVVRRVRVTQGIPQDTQNRDLVLPLAFCDITNLPAEQCQQLGTPGNGNTFETEIDSGNCAYQAVRPCRVRHGRAKPEYQDEFR